MVIPSPLRSSGGRQPVPDESLCSLRRPLIFSGRFLLGSSRGSSKWAASDSRAIARQRSAPPLAVAGTLFDLFWIEDAEGWRGASRRRHRSSLPDLHGCPFEGFVDAASSASCRGRSPRSCPQRRRSRPGREAEVSGSARPQRAECAFRSFVQPLELQTSRPSLISSRRHSAPLLEISVGTGRSNKRKTAE